MIEMVKIKSFAKSEYPPEFFENHVKLVVEKAKWLLGFYPEADEDVVKAAAWLHDIVHPYKGYKGSNHNIESAKKAKEYLSKEGIEKKKIKAILDCIRSHSSSKKPEPGSIEAKIVASADKLAHFDGYDFLAKEGGEKWVKKKLERDLNQEFMLPEAIKYAKRKKEEIENRSK